MGIILTSVNMQAQYRENWEPTGNWPFINQKFRSANVYHGIFKKTKTQVPCNIHVEKLTLWFSQNDTLKEAVAGSVNRVEFPNGDVYMPLPEGLARVVKEDTLQGQIARLFCVRKLNRKALDQRGVDNLNKTQNLLQSSGGGFMSAYLSAVADANSEQEENLPLPMKNTFYIQFKGEIFIATTKNILAKIRSERKKEYKAYTRSAEIISENESSMLKVWNDFFVKY